MLYPQFGTSPPSATLGRLDTWHGFKKIKPSFYLDFMVIKRGFTGDFMGFCGILLFNFVISSDVSGGLVWI